MPFDDCLLVSSRLCCQEQLRNEFQKVFVVPLRDAFSIYRIKMRKEGLREWSGRLSTVSVTLQAALHLPDQCNSPTIVADWAGEDTRSV